MLEAVLPPWNTLSPIVSLASFGVLLPPRLGCFLIEASLDMCRCDVAQNRLPAVPALHGVENIGRRSATERCVRGPQARITGAHNLLLDLSFMV